MKMRDVNESRRYLDSMAISSPALSEVNIRPIVRPKFRGSWFSPSRHRRRAAGNRPVSSWRRVLFLSAGVRGLYRSDHAGSEVQNLCSRLPALAPNIGFQRSLKTRSGLPLAAGEGRRSRISGLLPATRRAAI